MQRNRSILSVLREFRYTGVADEQPRIVRQVVLTNVSALAAAFITVAYEVFFLVYGVSPFLVLFGINMLALVIYLLMPWVNQTGHYNIATNLGLTTTAAHVFVVTSQLGTGAGFQLFYLTIAGVLPLLFQQFSVFVLSAFGAVAITLFLVCHFAFPVGAVSVALTDPILHVMYAVSAVSTLSLTIIFGYLFKLEMDQIHARLAASNRTLSQLTTTDELTRVVNRRGMELALDREWARMRRDDRPLSLLLCDVDCFKAYNDHYGHQAGDEVLRGVARAIQGSAWRPTDLVARYGGEEFVVILPDTTHYDACRVAERIRRAVQALGVPHVRSEAAEFVTISVGSSTMTPEMIVTAKSLLGATDRALYRAKRTGRNRVEFLSALAD